MSKMKTYECKKFGEQYKTYICNHIQQIAPFPNIALN